MNVLAVDDIELATILAALRLWQENITTGAVDDMPPRFADIATNNDEFDPLISEQIDVLCEKINFESGPLQVIVVMDGGLVHNVVVDREGVDLAVLDYDTEGAGEDGLVDIPQSDGSTEEAYWSPWEPTVNPEWIRWVHAAVPEDTED